MNDPTLGMGMITQYFGGNPEAYAQFGLLGHNGLDYGLPVGSPVYAALDGKVTKIQTDPDGYGLHIRLSHFTGGKETARTIYAHLSAVCASMGQTVMQGDMIARSGNSGYSTGPHLHFEYRPMPLQDNGYNGAIDPLPMIDGAAEASGNNVSTSMSIPDTGTATVTWATLSMREEPNDTAARAGYWVSGVEIPFEAIIQVGGDIWMKYSVFGREYYSALYYQGAYTCSISEV